MKDREPERNGCDLSLDRLLAHRGWVTRVARALVGEENRAADLEQQVWLKAIQNRPRALRSVRGWLGAVLRTTALDMHRSDSRRAVLEERAGRSEVTAPPPDLPAVKTRTLPAGAATTSSTPSTRSRTTDKEPLSEQWRIRTPRAAGGRGGFRMGSAA